MKKLTVMFIGLLLVVPCRADIIIVDANGTGDYPTIQAAIDNSNNDDIIELQQGVYTGNGNRDIDFLGKAITVRSTDPNAPDIVAATIIDCEGTQAEPHRGFYFHSGEDANSVLDGFTITNGYSDWGGGVLCGDSSPTISNCIFSGNSADEDGGGIGYFSYLQPVQATLANCTFIGNSAEFGGAFTSAGIDFGWVEMTLTDCTFRGNSAEYGGGALNDFDDGTMSNCIIVGNSADGGGGLYSCSGTMANCVISGNRATGQDGGGLLICNGTMTNCIITGNWSNDDGGGLARYLGDVSNCIIWNNRADDEGDQLFSADYVTYSCIQNSWPGLGNIDDDPCFVDPGYWEDPCGTPDWYYDDYWVDGDYHLKSEGWRWDSVRQRWDYDDVTSRCIDAGNPGSSLGEELLTIPDDDPNNEWGENLRINMGAYGGTEQASMPPYDWALLSDITNDGTVDFVDYAHLAGMFIEQDDELPADFDRNGCVDLVDLKLLAEDWLKATSWHGP